MRKRRADDPVNAIFWCTGLLTSFAHDLPEGFRTWIPPIHHFSIPLAKPGGRKKPFWDVRNGCFWILLQDKCNSVVAVRHNPTPALHFTDLNGWCIRVFLRIKAARQRAHELRSMPIHEIGQLHISIRFHFHGLPLRPAPPAIIADAPSTAAASQTKPGWQIVVKPTSCTAYSRAGGLATTAPTR